jgi:hypothetical protein
MPGEPGGPLHPAAPMDSLPMETFRDFLRRLHDGPPQHAAAVKVALAVWEGALRRGDTAGAQAATQMVREEMNRLVESITSLQAHGRRLSGEE